MLRLLALSVAALTLATAVAGYTAANSVPPTRLDDVQARNYAGNDPQKAQDFAPPQCVGIRSSLQRIVYIGGSPGAPSNQGALILGRPVNDNINAGRGNDCVLGGGGNDTLNGQAGDDVLIGGPGTDSLDGGPGTDICYGEVLVRCETTYSPG
jgi:Ca2+-binding RTX toxin-like protein